MVDEPTKEDLQFVNKMGAGEHKIKYNEDKTATLVYKNKDGQGHLGIPLEWSDRECLEAVSEDIENAIKFIKEDFSGNFSKGMGIIEGTISTIKLHMSKDDLWIVRDKAKKEHEEYLKRGRGALN